MKRFWAAGVLGFWLAAAASAQQPPDALEFYGYATTGPAAPKLAFLRQGGRIIIAAEGDLFEDEYRLVRIAADSVVIEHTSDRHRQTLQLAAAKPGSGAASAEPAPGPARPASPRTTRRTVRPMAGAELPAPADDTPQ